MINHNHPSVRPLHVLLQVGLFTGLGIAVAHWFFDNAIAGAVLGMSTYFLLVLLIMVGDIVTISRELAALRKGEEIEPAPSPTAPETTRNTHHA